jgi:ribosomal protein S12 methylthiotransferase accessory factor
MESEGMKVVLGEGMKVDVIDGAYTIHTDQPVSVGGEGSAPAPYQLFLASLAACAGFYVKRYCQTRGISEEGIALTQELLAGPDGRLGTIRIAIQLPPGFPEEHKAAVRRAAEHCAVKKTIANPPAFDIVCE